MRPRAKGGRGRADIAVAKDNVVLAVGTVVVVMGKAEGVGVIEVMGMVVVMGIADVGVGMVVGVVGIVVLMGAWTAARL